MKNKSKVIFHIDLNQFFCSVAMIKNPRLKGKAFAIGRENTQKGVISTASYEARKYGIHSGMSLVDAYKILPSLIIVNYGYEIYGHYSNLFFNILREYVDTVEQTSIDEGYMDVTDITIKKNIHPLFLAKEIQQRVLKELDLPCSIGIAPTLFLAKMASDLKKPLGITILRIRDVSKLLYPLKVKDIYGVGKTKIPYFEINHIETIGDFADLKNEEIVRKIMGSSYDYFINCLKGLSNNIVKPNRYGDPESMSKCITFDNPILNEIDLLNELFYMVDYLSRDLKSIHKKTKNVGITLRDTDFKTFSHSKSLKEATNDKTIIKIIIEDLVEEFYNNEPIRLAGISFTNFANDTLQEEINLFNYDKYLPKKEVISNLIGNFEKKYGENSLFFIKNRTKKN